MNNLCLRHGIFRTLVCQACAMERNYAGNLEREREILPQVARGALALRTVSASGVKHLRMFREPRLTFCGQSVATGWRAGALKFSELGQTKLCHGCLTKVEELMAKETA